MDMRILVCGSRSFTQYQDICDCLDVWCRGVCKPGDISIISGEAKGADLLAKKYALENNIKYIGVPADWETYGRSAGYIRNKEMIDLNPDLVIACWDGKSLGTKHTINLAKNKKIPTLIIWA